MSAFSQLTKTNADTYLDHPARAMAPASLSWCYSFFLPLVALRMLLSIYSLTICLSQLYSELCGNWDLPLHCILPLNTRSGSWILAECTDKWIKDWRCIFHWYCPPPCPPLWADGLGAVVVRNDKLGSRSPLSHSWEMERADRSLMKLSLVPNQCRLESEWKYGISQIVLEGTWEGESDEQTSEELF